MVNVNTQLAPGVDFPSGESSLFTSAGSGPGRERRPRLPASHGLHPGGVSEPRRPLKGLLGPRAWWGEEEAAQLHLASLQDGDSFSEHQGLKQAVIWTF